MTRANPHNAIRYACTQIRISIERIEEEVTELVAKPEDIELMREVADSLAERLDRLALHLKWKARSQREERK